MSLWSAQIAPRLTNMADSAEVRGLRAQACAGLTGEVLEIGFGSGLNLPHYPATVRQVTAVEPSGVARRLAGRRVASAPVPVRFGAQDAARLPFADGSFDAALSTLTLCTVDEVERAALEVLRVLKPGSFLHFLEHGRAPDAGVARWQRRLEPLQKRAFAGCHLTRDVPALLGGAGFELTELTVGYLSGPSASRPWTYVFRGLARKPA